MSKETLEEAASRFACGWGENDDEKSFLSGAKYQAEKMYTEEEVHSIVSSYSAHLPLFKPEFPYGKWFEQFKKK